MNVGGRHCSSAQGMLSSGTAMGNIPMQTMQNGKFLGSMDGMHQGHNQKQPTSSPWMPGSNQGML